MAEVAPTHPGVRWPDALAGAAHRHPAERAAVRAGLPDPRRGSEGARHCSLPLHPRARLLRL